MTCSSDVLLSLEAFRPQYEPSSKTDLRADHSLEEAEAEADFSEEVEELVHQWDSEEAERLQVHHVVEVISQRTEERLESAGADLPRPVQA